MKEQLLAYLQNQTAFFSIENVSDVFTAKDIAEKFSVKRNTISHYLNQLTEEGRLVKIATRPVYFFHKQAFEIQNYPLKKTCMIVWLLWRKKSLFLIKKKISFPV